ncbi:MAG TPA: nicotinate phosphoribosyltransferase [Ignavibacteriaceae bacterium]|nr:nicotinate phosphoribosyltransferase [Ignavibacteriaceae bacterium]
MNLIKRNSGLFTDHYELTMAQGYFLDGRQDLPANFDYFFRKNPFNSGYAIFAGLQDLLKMIPDFQFDSESIDHLHKIGFRSDFLEYLKNFIFKGNIYAPNEGEVVFANEPILRFEGNIIETQLIETISLNILNFQSLIATKASRLRYSAGERMLIDFGMRRAHGLSAIHGSRAAIIGGVDSTSNVYSAYLFGMTSGGTQAHSWIQSYGDELTAFRKYAEAFPDNCVLLVDTFDTLKSGVPNAITVGRELEERGAKLKAIRLDSGDLAYLSKKSRKMLDDAELQYVKIVASNQLDEYLIKSLIEQGAPIDIFGVGTNLITGQKDAALDGVYKLSMINENPSIKLSNDLEKVTLPGVKKIIRYFNGNDKFYADGIALNYEEEPDRIFHPLHPLKSSIVQGMNKEEIQSKVFSDGKIIMKEKSINEIKEYVKERINKLPDEHKRFDYPHIYKIGISSKIMNLRNELITEITEKNNKGEIL